MEEEKPESESDNSLSKGAKSGSRLLAHLNRKQKILELIEDDDEKSEVAQPMTNLTLSAEISEFLKVCELEKL